MKASLLLPLLPLLLLGVNSQDVASASPGQATTTSKVKDPSPGDSPHISTTSHPTVSGAFSTSKVGSPSPTTVPSPTTDQKIMPTDSSRNSPSTLAVLSATVQVTTLPNNMRNSPPNPMTLPFAGDQKVTSSTISGASAATPAATSSVSQQKTSHSASLGSSPAITAANPVLTHALLPTITGGLGIAVTSPSSVEAHRSQPLDQLTSTTVSTGLPRSNLPPELKDYGVSSPTSVAKQTHSSSSSPAQGPESSTRPGSISTSVTPFGASAPHTTGKSSLSLPPGGIDKVSEAATTLSPGADHRSTDARSAPTKPVSADWRPASAQPSAPTPRDHTVSSCSDQQHPNASFQNEVICKDQVQNNRPTIYLKEAKTCAEWMTASANISFFESFCSTGQHTFNASREACTVTLTSHEPQSQQWAVQAVVHIPLDPEKVLEELKEKDDKLEELGIANITYDKIEREMIINDEFSTPLIITIVTLAGSLLLIAAIYGCCHQRFSQKKDQQRLTEELQTMENGYHDNPTLEVMETSSEMQEKKVNLNGELGDSWIVPLDTLMKEDLEEEEDTHL